jgi:hypothetical protein
MPALGTSTLGVITTSVAVATVGMSPAYTPAFIVTQRYGALIVEPALTVSTVTGTASIQPVAYTDGVAYVS